MNGQDEKTLKEVQDIVEKFKKLQDQINNPDRQGMLEALQGAQSVAFFEVRSTERQQGDNVLMPWESFRDDDLYRKLSQYQIALRKRAIELVGEKVFKELLKK